MRGLGQHTDAVAVAARALELRKLAELFGPQAPEEPFPVEALEIHADCLFELGHFGGAAATARQLLRHDAANSLYWFLLTRALIEAQEWNEVLDAAEQWIKIDPCGNAWSRKVQALMELGRWEDARKGAGIVLALRPGDPNALSLGSTACIGCGDLESALKYAERMGS